ncbi:glycoside hydrolase family 36 protein [Vibrio sp.]|uniref:glycoside hydrolase family 36 protein n=1 Tax=Vibrio sp. TaxID=678 RepID=UPI003D0A5692
MSNCSASGRPRKISIQNPDVVVERDQHQLHFRFNGLSNNPVSDHYLLCTTPFDFEHSARILGDGFQMLAQTSGYLSQPVDVGRCPDNSRSYRIYPSTAAKRYYNYLVIEQAEGFSLFGFTSCHRFAGYFEIAETLDGPAICAYIDGEHTHPQDWTSCDLESMVMLTGPSLDELYDQYSHYLTATHPPRHGVTRPAPCGWCSWYAYYAEATEQDIYTNLACMEGELSSLEWVLIDDGYQAYMGDWLTPSDKFSSGVKSLVADIKAKGKKAAIWLAPFIAQPESELFRQHPDWFVRHADGRHLKAEDVTYAGWRCTPWYILDTSHPGAQHYLTQVFKTMREEWGVEMFKLDANYWGTLKGARHTSGMTGVEAYRLGMEAIAEGAGEANLIGCNAPMWPSLGLVDAMRVSDDVERDPRRFAQIARETFFRSWQHRRLWQIDPDCATFVSLPNQGAERSAYEFHRDVLLASGGLLLSGDPLPDLTPFAKASWQKLMLRQRFSQSAARFSSLSLSHACLALTDQAELHCVFNYQGPSREITLRSEQLVHWFDYWTGRRLSDEPSCVFSVSLSAGLSSRAILAAPVMLSPA